MAKYTIELYCLIDNFLPEDKDLDDMYVEGKTPQEMLEIMKFYQKFGLADYDVYGETVEEQRNNRDRINHKILEHFYFREIGEETPDRFKIMMRRTMKEIMPYYNQYYNTEKAEFDFLKTTNFVDERNIYGDTQDVKNRQLNSSMNTEMVDKNTGSVKNKDTENSVEDLQRTSDNTRENVTSGSVDHTDVFQDTPAGLLNGQDYATTKDKLVDTYNDLTIDDESKAKENRNITSQNTKEKEQVNDLRNENNTNTNFESNQDDKRNKDYRESNKFKREGYNGFSPDDLLKKHRNNILNIDMRVLEELQPLFMTIY